MASSRSGRGAGMVAFVGGRHGGTTESDRKVRGRSRGLATAVAVLAVVVLLCGPAAVSGAQAGDSITGSLGPPIVRVAGVDAIGTSIATSKRWFPGIYGPASAVVLARSDYFSDALAGGPLAATVNGPLLITPGAALSATLDPRVLAEIQRVIPAPHPVLILGGPLALSPSIDATLVNLGYQVLRLQGANQFATAVSIGAAIEFVRGPVNVIFEATGLHFADALSAVPATIQQAGVILLTNGATQSPETAAALSAHAPVTRYAIGGPLAAFGADPSAIPIYGNDLWGTSAAVAQTFFPFGATPLIGSPLMYGAATGLNFPDALSGGPILRAWGPMLLVGPHAPIPSPIADYLAQACQILGYAFGGPLAVGDDALAGLEAAVGSMAVCVA